MNHDLAYALRGLRKQPIFTAVAVLTLAVGIGANTALFSLLYHVVLRPLPYPDATRLVFIWNAYKKAGNGFANVSIPDYLDRGAEVPAIEDAALFTKARVSLSIAGQPEQVIALRVTPSFFSTLGRQPLLGRAFTDADAEPATNRFVILTHALWSSRFGRDPSVIGRSIHLDGVSHAVVGVLPADFEIPSRDVALLVPFGFTPEQRSDQERGNEFSEMIARLRPGATIEQANAQMDAIVARLMDRVPGRAAYMRNSGFTGVAEPFRDHLVGDARASLWLLQAAVFVVLLIACANVANLVLMRASGRQRELAIRSSLGAGQWRIARQLLTEGAVLSVIGTCAGLAVAALGIRTLIAITADQLPSAAGAAICPEVLLFTIALATMSAIIFAVSPVITTAGRSAASALKDDAGRASASTQTGRLRATLVVVETALAVVLLVGAGLLIKSFASVLRVDPGFSTEHVLTAQITLPVSRYPDDGTTRAFWARLLERTRGIPGVSAAGAISGLPFSGATSAGTYRIAGRSYAPGQRPPHAQQDFAAGDYFRAMQIPLLQGRLFSDADGADAPRVVIVDELFANRQFRGQSPVGRQINFGSARNYTIVGVVGTIRYEDLGKPVLEERIYLNATQLPLRGMTLVVKAALEPSSLVPELRFAAEAIDPEQPIADIRTMEEWIGRSLQPRRTPMMLLSVFGIVALLLSAIGIYGVVAFGVAERVREFGIRQALGADRRSILSLVLVQGLSRAGVGIAIGVAGSLVVTRYLKSMLTDVAPHDTSVFAAVIGILAGVAVTACYLPAHRATRVEPMEALRQP
jgi:putative ABC transport system permease protein